MSEVYVVTSGKGGVGKTTSSANIGAGLAFLGKKVVLIDADIGLRNLDIVMGLENRIVYDIVNVIEGSAKLKQALVRGKMNENLCLLPAAQTRDNNSITPEQMKKICDNLKSDFDFIIIDCPTGIEQGFRNAIAGADKAIVITTPDVVAVRDAHRIMGLLEANKLKEPKLVLNRVKPNMTQRGGTLSPDEVSEILPIHLLGVVPEDEYIAFSTSKGEPCIANKKSIAGKAYREIVRRMLGENLPPLDLPPKTGFTTRIKGIFERRKTKWT